MYEIDSLERNFESLSIKELERHFGRNQRTIRGWIKKLKENGYIKESA
ncbi:helix-turn-helix domain-containing protein [Ammoniphilus sp. 3BR4]